MRARLAAFLIFIAAFTAAYSAGAEVGVSEREAEVFMEGFNELIDGIDGFGIFLHNANIALPMFVPGFGVAWGLFSAWSTGMAFSAISSTAPQLESIPPLAILYASPFGIMELVAYSLGMSRSALLVHAVAKKNPLGPQLKPTAAEVGVVLCLLLGGGYLEFYMIESAAPPPAEAPQNGSGAGGAAGDLAVQGAAGRPGAAADGGPPGEGGRTGPAEAGAGGDRPEAPKTPELGLLSQQPAIDAAELEMRIHALTNQHRAENDLQPLSWDGELSDIARAHSDDMALRGYFSHDTPEGADPTDRARDGGYGCRKIIGNMIYTGVAENIFQGSLYNSTLLVAGLPVSYDWNSQEEIARTTVDGWMDSPGHRKNILTPTYDREGIGVSIAPDDKVYVTQNLC